MADVVDMAQTAESALIESALGRHRRRPPRRWTTHCEDCGEEIPIARRRAIPTATRCATCQEQAEAICE